MSNYQVGSKGKTSAGIVSRLTLEISQASKPRDGLQIGHLPWGGVRVGGRASMLSSSERAARPR